MRIRKLFPILVFCAVVISSYGGSRYISSMFSLQSVPLEVTVCDLSKNLIYRCSYKESCGFVVDDSIAVAFRNVVPGFYRFEAADSGGIKLKICYPQETACRQMVVGTADIETGCPYVLTDSVGIGKLKDFLAASRDEMGVFDSLCYVDSSDYKRMLSQWRLFLESYLDFEREGSVENLDSFYSVYYRDGRGRDIQSIRKAIKLERSLNDWIEIKDEAPVVMVDRNFAYISFYQRVYTGKKVEFIRKFLVLIEKATGWKIVFENSRMKKVEYIRDIVENFINNWKKAWESLEIDQYRKFYSPEFKAGNMGLTEWLSYKRKVFNNLRWVNVGIENLNVLNQGKMTWRVEFLQHYSSDKGGDTGYKILYVRGFPENLKITKEIWMPVSR